MSGVGVLCINFLKIILFWYTDFFSCKGSLLVLQGLWSKGIVNVKDLCNSHKAENFSKIL